MPLVILNFPEIDEDLIFEGAQLHIQPFFAQLLAVSDIFQTSDMSAIDAKTGFISGQPQTFSECLLDEGPVIPISRFNRISDGSTNPSLCLIVFVIIDHQGPFLSCAIRIGKDIFIDITLRAEKVIEQEIFYIGK